MANGKADVNINKSDDSIISILKTPKYLQCPAIFTIGLLKKFILNKFEIDSNRFCVEVMYKVKTIALPDHYTLMDVAYIYTWKRVSKVAQSVSQSGGVETATLNILRGCMCLFKFILIELLRNVFRVC